MCKNTSTTHCIDNSKIANKFILVYFTWLRCCVFIRLFLVFRFQLQLGIFEMRLSREYELRMNRDNSKKREMGKKAKQWRAELFIVSCVVFALLLFIRLDEFEHVSVACVFLLNLLLLLLSLEMQALTVHIHILLWLSNCEVELAYAQCTTSKLFFSHSMDEITKQTAKEKSWREENKKITN